MPKLKVNGIEIRYTEKGSGPPLVFGHSLTLDGSMYDEAAARLSKSFRTVQIDFRGHGNSDKPDADYTLDDVSSDVYELIRALGLKSMAYVGLSMGGMVGMRLAIRESGLFRAMVLLDTSAEEEERRDEYEQWAEMTKDMEPNEPQAQAVLNLLTAPGFAQERPEVQSRLMERLLSNHMRGVYRASLAVVRRDSILDRLGTIGCPVLVVVGEKDIATPPKHAEVIHRAIPGSELFEVPGSGHLSILEKPDIVIPKMETFLSANMTGRS